MTAVCAERDTEVLRARTGVRGGGEATTVSVR